VSDEGGDHGKEVKEKEQGQRLVQKRELKGGRRRTSGATHGLTGEKYRGVAGWRSKGRIAVRPKQRTIPKASPEGKRGSQERCGAWHHRKTKTDAIG